MNRGIPKFVVALVMLLLPVRGMAEEGFTNSLGMKFVPVPGTEVLFCTTEVTVEQYNAAGLGYEEPEFVQAKDHPAVNVSWNDAKKYCEWLSKRDGRKYRLPTDHEWSCAVGIGHLEDEDASPESKVWKIKDVYPWGKGKPNGKAGNYMGQEWRRGEAGKAYRAKYSWMRDLIPGYEDGYLFTSPVGSFAQNRLGIYDLGGNVWEWCEDKYKASEAWRVLRGGSWLSRDRDRLLSSDRISYGPEVRGDSFGFRVVCGAGSGR